MPGSYSITSNNKGGFAFVLKAGNGQVILRSEVYDSKAAAQKGVASVQANAGRDDRYELKVAKDGRTYFNLLAANGQVIGTSQMYASLATRARGIASVKVNGATTRIREA